MTLCSWGDRAVWAEPGLALSCSLVPWVTGCPHMAQAGSRAGTSRGCRGMWRAAGGCGELPCVRPWQPGLLAAGPGAVITEAMLVKLDFCSEPAALDKHSGADVHSASLNQLVLQAGLQSGHKPMGNRNRIREAHNGLGWEGSQRSSVWPPAMARDTSHWKWLFPLYFSIFYVEANGKMCLQEQQWYRMCIQLSVTRRARKAVHIRDPAQLQICHVFNRKKSRLHCLIPSVIN